MRPLKDSLYFIRNKQNLFSKKSDSLVKILDVFGKELLSTELRQQVTETNINNTLLNSGLYVVNLIKPGETIKVLKFFKN
ncbi:MAG: T9SS type A sorting domain-containing protein [Saprospiraceae bacterium]|nr:T9SS type A sorting domain-containing protein [Saprospiraceae bacterium]